MKKIFINGKYLSVRMTGVQRVAHELVPRIVILFQQRGIEVEICKVPHWIMKSKYQSIWGTLWEQLVLPFVSRNGLLVNLCNASPIFTPKNQVVAIYDAAVFDMPKNYSLAYRAWTKLMAYSVAVRRDMLFTSSSFSLSRISKFLGIEKSCLNLLRASGQHILSINKDYKIFQKLSIQPKKYILAVGSLQPGKNFQNLLLAMKHVDEGAYLVIAGGKDGLVFASGIDLSGDRYVHAGYVTDEELAALYEGALCFVQPSVYEGFGLPAAEAMALGTPIACSSATSLPEVCGQAAAYFDPHKPEEIAHAINRIIKDENFRNELIFQASKQTEFYDWDVAAAEFVQNIVVKMDNVHA